MALHYREFQPEKDLCPLYTIFNRAKNPEKLGISFPLNSDELFMQWLNLRLKNYYHTFFVVVDAHDSPIGVLYSYNCRQADANCWVYLYLSEEKYIQDGLVLLKNFLKYLFCQYPFHKIFLEMSASEKIAQLLISFEIFPECILKEHSFIEGKYQDLIIWGVKRDDLEL